MTDKHLLQRDDTVRPAIYRAAKSRETTQQGMLDRLLQRAFSGSAAKMLIQLLSSKPVSSKELAEVKQLLKQIEQKEKRGRKPQ